jgi:hypothetical protein
MSNYIPVPKEIYFQMKAPFTGQPLTLISFLQFVHEVTKSRRYVSKTHQIHWRKETTCVLYSEYAIFEKSCGHCTDVSNKGAGRDNYW